LEEEAGIRVGEWFGEQVSLGARALHLAEEFELFLAFDALGCDAESKFLCERDDVVDKSGFSVVAVHFVDK
jgi:hypothetical protein